MKRKGSNRNITKARSKLPSSLSLPPNENETKTTQIKFDSKPENFIGENTANVTTEIKTKDIEIIFSYFRGANLEPSAAVIRHQPKYIRVGIIALISAALVPLFLRYINMSDILVSISSLVFSLIFALIYTGILLYFFFSSTFDFLEGENFEKMPQAERLKFNVKAAVNLRKEIENNTDSADKIGLLKAFAVTVKNEIDYVYDVFSIITLFFTAYISIWLAILLITNSDNSAKYKMFSVVLTAAGSAFVVIVRAKAAARLKMLKKWHLISELSQNL